MKGAGPWLSVVVVFGGHVAWLAAPAPAAFIWSADFAELPCLEGMVLSVQSAPWGMSGSAGLASTPLWWPEVTGNRGPQVVLGKACALPSSDCGSMSHLTDSQGGYLPLAGACGNPARNPVLGSRWAIFERRLSRLPPVPLQLLRPA